MIFAGKHARCDKRLLRLEREMNRLGRAQGCAPVIPLERPYQRGWVKSYVLRDDARHHPEAAVFATVLPAINRRVLCRRRDFLHASGQPVVLRPRVLDLGEWRRLAWTLRHQRLFAHGLWDDDEFYAWACRTWRHRKQGFKLVSTWWLEERIEPHLITHQRVELPEVRRRLAEIEGELRRICGHEHLTRLHGRRVRWRGEPDPTAVQRADASWLDACNSPD